MFIKDITKIDDQLYIKVWMPVKGNYDQVLNFCSIKDKDSLKFFSLEKFDFNPLTL